MNAVESAEPVFTMPISVRGASLSLVAILASVMVLRLAQEVFIPIAIATLLAYALDPFVVFLQRFKIPRFIATTLVLLTLVAGAGMGLYSLRDEASAVVDELPEAAKKLRSLVRASRGDGTTAAIDKVQEAADQIEKTAADATRLAQAPAGVTRVQLEVPALGLRDRLWASWQGAAGLVTRAVMVLFLAYFLLLSGDLFKRKLVKISGIGLARKRVTVQILDQINGQIERFLIVRLIASAIVAATIWPALAWTGLNHAVIWGIVAGSLNVIPYFGPAIVTGCLAVVAFLQFGTLSMVAYVVGVCVAVTSLEGWFLTPKLMGRAARMNEVAIFVGLIFWTWLWGVWGLLLAVPLLMVIKAICDHIEGCAWVGEMMGD